MEWSNSVDMGTLWQPRLLCYAERGGKRSSVWLSAENRWGGLYSCVHTLYVHRCNIKIMHLACVFVCVDAFVWGPPRGAQVRRGEICGVGRGGVTNAWYLDSCKDSVSPSASVPDSHHREQQQSLQEQWKVRFGEITATGPLAASIYSPGVIMGHTKPEFTLYRFHDLDKKFKLYKSRHLSPKL